MTTCCWCGVEKICKKREYCQSELNERHELCSTCHLNGHACQSSCPVCWYDLAEKFLTKDNLCCGCIQPLNDLQYKIDLAKHKLCFYCNECILCQFRLQKKKEFFQLTYRQQDCQIQKILYLMQICVQCIESDYDLCSICMDVLNNNKNNIRILDQCKHRFHSNCIEQWFQFKSCCPCCRQIYQTIDQPKAKRMRIQTHNNVPIPID